MADWARIEADLAELLAADGYELVQLQAHTGKGAHLQVLADRLGEPGTITLDECVVVSQKVSAFLDVEDPFNGAYRLQVSSPGVDRPLSRLEHFGQFTGRLAKVTVRHEGRRETFTGRLAGVADETIWLDVDGVRIAVVWPEVTAAHVVYEWSD